MKELDPKYKEGEESQPEFEGKGIETTTDSEDFFGLLKKNTDLVVELGHNQISISDLTQGSFFCARIEKPDFLGADPLLIPELEKLPNGVFIVSIENSTLDHSREGLKKFNEITTTLFTNQAIKAFDADLEYPVSGVKFIYSDGDDMNGKKLDSYELYIEEFKRQRASGEINKNIWSKKGLVKIPFISQLMINGGFNQFGNISTKYPIPWLPEAVPHTVEGILYRDHKAPEFQNLGARNFRVDLDKRNDMYPLISDITAFYQAAYLNGYVNSNGVKGQQFLDQRFEAYRSNSIVRRNPGVKLSSDMTNWQKIAYLSTEGGFTDLIWQTLPEGADFNSIYPIDPNYPKVHALPTQGWFNIPRLTVSKEDGSIS